MVGSGAKRGEPSIVVVPEAASDQWPRLLADAPSVIARADVEGAVAALVAERDAAISGRVATLELVLGDLVAELDRAVAARDGCQEELSALLRWADWCEAQPAESAEDVTALAEATRTVQERSAEARDASRALDDVLEQQATAEAALEEARMEVEANSAPGLAESDVRHELERAERELATATTEQEQAAARRRVEVLHRTLSVRAEPRRDGQPHHDAVAALARQAGALEARLAEAVGAARERSDAALRALARAEQVLERLHHRERGRHRRLRDAVAELPVELRPREQDGLLAHADHIADGLRVHAESRRPELDAHVVAVQQLEERRAEVHRELDEVRSTMGRGEDGDLVVALRQLVDAAGAAPVVLDEPLSADQWPAVLEDLAARPPATRVLVLTRDPAVVDWAIDLPATVGGVVMAGADAEPAPRSSPRSVPGSVPAPAAGGAESLQFDAEPADAQDAAETGDEPIISIDRLRAFAFRSPSECRSSDEP